MISENPKYQKWYDGLILSAQRRDISSPYSEVHHIEPRSLGGADHPSNLVRLTYRQHFIAHWLLTKFHTGRNLRKMQRALFAMTLKANGTRIVAGWQFEVAKRAIKDLKLSTSLRIAAERARKQYLEQNSAAFAAREKELISLSNALLKENKSIKVLPVHKTARLSRRRRRPRPGKRLREAMRVNSGSASANASSQSQ